MEKIDKIKLFPIQKIILICGVLSSVIYLATDIIAAINWSDFYDYTSQGFSEYLAYQTPTRPFVLSLSIFYNLLVITFGLCLCLMKDKKITFRITGILLIGYAVVGMITPAFFPAPMRGVEATFRNEMHLPLTFIEVIFILLSIGFGAVALGKKFRIYSVATFVLLTVCATWAGSFVSSVASNKPTPGMGIIERGNIYGYLLWVMMFAICVLKDNRKNNV